MEAAERILRFIRSQMATVNIHFDEWFSQASIQETGFVAETIDGLRSLVYEEDGALYGSTPSASATPGEGGPQVPEQGGDYTYLAGDVAYHRNVPGSAATTASSTSGADHQGQVSSLLAGVEALGVEKGRLEVRIGQMVSLAGGRIGKRLGNAVDLDDLVDDIGPDVMRLLSLVASLDQAPTIDLDKVGPSLESPSTTSSTPARIHSIGKKADELGVARADSPRSTSPGSPHERELELLRTLDTLPEVVELACLERAPHKVTAWVGSWPTASTASTTTAASSATTSRRADPGPPVAGGGASAAVGLDLLGVAAPESM